MSIWGDRLTALTSFGVAAAMAFLSWNFPANGDIFPKFITGSIALIAVLLFLRTMSVKSVYQRRSVAFHAREELLPLVLTAAFVGYALLIFVLGYYTTTLLFLVLLSVAVGIRSPKTIGLAAVIALPLLYAFFELFLGANMPQGLLI